MKIGLIFCAYGIPEYVNESLNPWIKLKDKYDIKITACHGLFKEYHENGIEDNDFDTQNQLLFLRSQNKIDYLYVQNHYGVDFATNIKKYETEAKIRDYCLQYLLKENVDYVILWDLDEFATEIQIENLFNYIGKTENKFYNWFSIEYKNLVFTENQYIEGFCPPRVFKTNTYNLRLNEIYWDNDLSYTDGKKTISYKELSSKKIPKSIINPNHKTWLSNNRSKEKVNYQLKHFGHCGYKWDETNNQLEFDQKFYQKINQKIPNILTIK